MTNYKSRSQKLAGRAAIALIAALTMILCETCGKDPVTINQPPRAPSNPRPENGSTSASIQSILEWQCSDPEGDALTYDVYFGEALAPPLATSEHTGMTYSPGTLVFNGTYYWKVVAKDGSGNYTEGPVWTFKTAGNEPPTAASYPLPLDNASDVAVTTTLRWQASDPNQDVLTYDIFFGVSPSPPYVAQQAETEYAPPQDLELSKDYYWRIDVGDGYNMVPGPVWHFKTGDNQPPSMPFDPTPEHQSADQTIDVELQWNASDPENDPLKFDVKLDQTDPPITVVASDISQTSFATNGLDDAAVYFWQVIVRDDHGNKRDGPVWRFTTAANHPPSPPSDPAPASGSADVPLIGELQWTVSDPENDFLTFDVVLDTNNPPAKIIASNITEQSFEPILRYATTYYWRVLARDDHENQTQGPVWSFTTLALSIAGNADTPGYARDIAVAGSYAYVADGGSGLEVIDASNPASPSIVGKCDTPGDANGVAVAGRYAYVADNTSGLQMIVVVTPTHTGIVGSCDTPDHALGVAAAGSYVYVADGESGLQVINVWNSGPPAIVGRLNTPGTALGVAVAGSYAYVADGESGLQVANVSNPSSPTIVDWLNTLGNAYGVAVAGSHAYVADGESGLQVFDVSNPASLVIVGNVDTPGTALGVTVTGSYAYVADGESGLQVINVSNPSSPLIVGSIDTPGTALGVAVAGSYAYVADGGSGLQVIRVE